MKTRKSVKFTIFGLIGCGICCLPLLLPVATGLIGASVFGFSLGQFLCGMIFLIVGIVLFGLYIYKKKNLPPTPLGK